MKKKKNLIIICGLLLIVVVGVTFAYFQSNTSFVNIFDTGDYKVLVTEEFVSPDNWVPGETIPKTVIAKNVGNIDAVVRISYTEKWEDQQETDITSQVNPNPAIINFTNQSDWIHEGNYYYYKYILREGEETSSFISGVSLDSNLNSVTCTGEGNTRTCEAQSPVSGAKYKLTFTIETIQYDVYKSEWTPDVDIDVHHDLIELPNGRNKDNLQVGDEICIYGETVECFNFIGYDGDNLKLLSKWNLKVGDILDVDSNYNDGRYGKTGMYTSSDTGYGVQSSEAKGFLYGEVEYGSVGFSYSNYWVNGGLLPKYGSSYPANVYDTDYKTTPDFSTTCGDNTCFKTPGYSIALYVDAYKDILVSYGVTIEDARLLTLTEATDESIGCDVSEATCPTDSFITNTSFWLGTAQGSNHIYGIYRDGDFMRGYYYRDAFGARPLIVIAKSEIE